jgi:rieske iron-sulfur protein
MAKNKSGSIQRRGVLRCMCALSLGVPILSQAQSGDEESLLPPQENDVLVFAFGDRADEPIGLNDLQVADKQEFAYTMDPDTKQIRNGTRLNQVLLKRLDTESLSEETSARAVNGIVAYSGVCTHTGCDVTDWNTEFNRFQCPCHESQFDPSDSARVVGGPAPWQLAALPLKQRGDLLVVAGEFEGRVGFQQGGLLSPFGI